MQYFSGTNIAYFGSIEGHGPCLFSGDTLFSTGCGRLFEGSPSQMHTSLQKLAALPSATSIFCAHEYTLANLAFAKAVMPDSAQVQNRINQCQKIRARNEPTLPARLGEELTYNPFLMSDDEQVIVAAKSRLGHTPHNNTEVFTTIRQWKDQF